MAKANLLRYSFRILDSADYVYGDSNNDRTFVLDVYDPNTERSLNAWNAIAGDLKLSLAADFQDYLANVYVFLKRYIDARSNGGSEAWGPNSMLKAERNADGTLTGVFHVWVDVDYVRPRGLSLYDAPNYTNFRVVPTGKVGSTINDNGIQFVDITASAPTECTVEPQPQSYGNY